MRVGTRIGVDIDGCLAKFNEAFCVLARAEYSHVIIPPGLRDGTWPTRWAYCDELGLTDRQEDALWARIRESGFWRRLDPIPGATAALTRLYQLTTNSTTDWRVYFITSRPGQFAHRHTVEWLAEHGYPWPYVEIVGDPHDKGLAAKALQLDAMIDDRPENLIAVKEHRPACVTYLVDRPYNRWALLRGDDYLAAIDHVVTSVSDALTMMNTPEEAPVYEDGKASLPVSTSRYGHPDFYRLLDELADIHSRKNRDYASTTDPLSNLRMSEKLGIPAHQGAFIRMGDKFARLEQLLSGKEAHVKEESVEDTFKDLAVYSLLALILYRERLHTMPHNPPTREVSSPVLTT